MGRLPLDIRLLPDVPADKRTCGVGTKDQAELVAEYIRKTGAENVEICRVAEKGVYYVRFLIPGNTTINHDALRDQLRREIDVWISHQIVTIFSSVFYCYV